MTDLYWVASAVHLAKLGTVSAEPCSDICMDHHGWFLYIYSTHILIFILQPVPLSVHLRALRFRCTESGDVLRVRAGCVQYFCVFCTS
jgi:hypothetical protein